MAIDSIPFRFNTAAASSLAPSVDRITLLLLVLCLIVFLGVVIAIVYFAARYHRGSAADRSGFRDGSRAMEYTWMVVPFLLFLAVFFWAARVYVEQYSPPGDATRIYVVGKQWMWKIQHENGKREINELHVPLGRPVELLMISQDVIHSFYVPAFRAKQDVLPGRYTSLWFQATETGRYHLFCAEFCGTGHSRMGGEVVVMKPADYEHWLVVGAPDTGAIREGAQLFRDRGCSGCHFGRSNIHAPPLAGIVGNPVQLAGGRSLMVDERYLRDSILEPDKEVVAGYRPLMPSFKGQLSEGEVLSLIAYIRSLQPVEQGERE